jgi:hypothetical protein
VDGGYTPGLAYQGEGLTIVGWFDFTDVAPVVAFGLFKYTYTVALSDSAELQLSWSEPGTLELLASNFDESTAAVISTPFPSGSGMTFIRAWFDPADGKIQMQINHGTILESSASINFPAGPAGTAEFQIFAQALPGTFNFTFDEVGIFQGVLNSNNDLFLYNGGDGKTWPF